MLWDHSSAGRASALQAEGHRFEPYWSHRYADVAQLAEQLICNQQVIGSSPIIGFMGEFPSGQRGQTVNLLAVLSVVRIHLPPLRERAVALRAAAFFARVCTEAGEPCARGRTFTQS